MLAAVLEAEHDAVTNAALVNHGPPVFRGRLVKERDALVRRQPCRWSVGGHLRPGTLRKPCLTALDQDIWFPAFVVTTTVSLPPIFS